MSRELRAELERLQSEVVEVRVATRAVAARIPEARAHAKTAEDALALVKNPLDQLQKENRALEKYAEWENSRPRPTIEESAVAAVLLAFAIAVIILFAFFLCLALVHLAFVGTWP